MFMVLGATLSTNYDTFTTFRSLQGLFGTVPQVIGLPIIHDMYSPEGKSLLIPRPPPLLNSLEFILFPESSNDK